MLVYGMWSIQSTGSRFPVFASYLVLTLLLLPFVNAWSANASDRNGASAPHPSLNAVSRRLIAERLNSLGFQAGDASEDSVRFSAASVAAIKKWQTANGEVADGRLNRTALSRLFKTIVVTAKSEKEGTVTVADLGGAVLGGKGEIRSHYSDPSLAGVGREACMRLCAADPSCNAFSNNHGCELHRDYSYIHHRDMTVDHNGRSLRAGVVLSRQISPGKTQTSFDPRAFDALVARIISNYKPSPAALDAMGPSAKRSSIAALTALLESLSRADRTTPELSGEALASADLSKRSAFKAAREASRALDKARQQGASDLPARSSQVAFDWIRTISKIQVDWADPEKVRAYSNMISSQYGRCFEDVAANRARSDAILRATAINWATIGPSSKQYDWLKRSTDCLTDASRINEILTARVGVAHALGDVYLVAKAHADIGHAQFNAGNRDAAKRAFEIAVGLHRNYLSSFHADFVIAIFGTNVQEDALEYYAEGSNRVREPWQALARVGIDDVFEYAAATFVRHVLDRGLLTNDLLSEYHLLHVATILERGNAFRLVDALYAQLEYVLSGTTNPSAINTILKLSQNKLVFEDKGIKQAILARAVKTAERRKRPDELVKVLIALARERDASGEVDKASSDARRALRVTKQQNVALPPNMLEELQGLLARVARETGAPDKLALEIASSLKTDLEAVCSGDTDLKAFPYLPAEVFSNDRFLVEAFFRQPVVNEYLECFERHASKLDTTDWTKGYIPADRLFDYFYILTQINKNQRLIEQLSRHLADGRWIGKHDDTKPTAFASALDALALSGKQALFGPFVDRAVEWWRDYSKANPEFIDDRIAPAVNRLVFGLLSRGDQDAALEMFRRLKRYASHAQQNNKYIGGKACTSACVVLYHFELTYGDPEVARKYLEPTSTNVDFHFPNATVEDRLKRRDALIVLQLHLAAGRTDIAKRYALAYYLDEGSTEDDLFRSPSPLANKNSVELASILTRIALLNGDMKAAARLSGHYVTSAQKAAGNGALLGEDSLVRWSSRLRDIFEAYLDSLPALDRSAEAGTGATLDANEHAFFALQFLQTTRTATTFAKISARIVQDNRGSVRKYQDLGALLTAGYERLANLQGSEARSLAARLSEQENERAVLLSQLDQSGRRAIDFGAIQFQSVADLQAALRPGEALLSTYVARRTAYAWVVTKEASLLRRLSRTPEQIDADIRRLRLMAEPEGAFNRTLDLAILYDIHQWLLAPFSRELLSTNKLIHVANGAFDALPLGSLLTEKPAKYKVQFEEIRKLRPAWLMRRTAIYQMPSIASISILRRYRSSIASQATQPFLGIGDPNFGAGVKVRDTDSGAVVAVQPVSQLPETRDELKVLGELLALDSNPRLILGDEAREQTIKGEPLELYNVIAFATHGIIANEIKGAEQPALLLTTPDNVSDFDDGMLTASEISSLKLDADLVILSACNTAASDGRPGAEGLSGLANAFFYAGARNLVVTHWQIPTRPAVAVTVGMINARSSQKSIDWAEALRRSTLAMSDGAGPEYYAHPFSWAAHVVVGVPE